MQFFRTDETRPKPTSNRNLTRKSNRRRSIEATFHNCERYKTQLLHNFAGDIACKML